MKITEGEFDDIVASIMEHARKGVFCSDENIEGCVIFPDCNELILIPIKSSIFYDALHVLLLRGRDLPVKIKGEIKFVPEISEATPVIVFKADTLDKADPAGSN
jgi:hypothetical protein